MPMGRQRQRFQFLGTKRVRVVSSPLHCTDKLMIASRLTVRTVTSEYEIIRGDLAKIFMDETEKLDRVKYLFDDMVTALEELPSGKVRATFANGLPQTEYDVVIGADGMMSRTRRILFGTGPNDDNYLYRLGQYAAYFTIPRTPEDTKIAQWYNAPGGRLIFLRPDPYNTTRAFLAVTDANLARFDEYDRLLREGTREQQEAWWEREFEGAGFQVERVLRGMKEADDFYTQEIAQVKMEQWVKGRVALLGDAAFCPSPISGVVCCF
jgi:2-polyprenyl-6-methoxyphenol hydroxylase-like FAD-dependent oxidoreductase